MNGLLLTIFLFILATVLGAISLGVKFLEDQRKKKVKSILDTASGLAEAGSGPQVLREAAKPTRLDEILSRLSLDLKLRTLIQQAGSDWTVPKLLGLMCMSGVAGAFLGYLLPVFMFRSVTALIFCVIFSVFPFVAVSRKRKKRLAAFEEQFPEALDFLARSMRAGHAFTVSLEMLGVESPDPLGQEFRQLFNEQNLGAPIEVCLQNFADRMPLLDVSFFVSSVLLQRQTGGNLSEILIRLAYIIRERFRLKGQVKAASAHGRITALILTILPIATAVILFIVAPGYLQAMAQDSDGKRLILAALCGQALGYYFMRRIIDIKV